MMRALFFLSLATVAACNAGGTSASTDVAAVRTAITANDRNVERWFGAGAVDSIAAGYYTPDAIVFEANAPPSKGSDAIRKLYAGYTAMGSIRAHLQMSDLVVADSVAVDYGTYSIEVRAKPPADTSKVLMTDHGNYVTTFMRRGGEWRSIYDIAVTDVPAPAPPPSKKK